MDCTLTMKVVAIFLLLLLVFSFLFILFCLAWFCFTKPATQQNKTYRQTNSICTRNAHFVVLLHLIDVRLMFCQLWTLCCTIPWLDSRWISFSPNATPCAYTPFITKSHNNKLTTTTTKKSYLAMQQ